jgi:hypothetical protein
VSPFQTAVRRFLVIVSLVAVSFSSTGCTGWRSHNQRMSKWWEGEQEKWDEAIEDVKRVMEGEAASSKARDIEHSLEKTHSN